MNKLNADDVLEVIELKEEYEQLFEEEQNKYPNWWHQSDYVLRKKLLQKAISEKKNMLDLDEVQVLSADYTIQRLVNNINDYNKKH